MKLQEKLTDPLTLILYAAHECTNEAEKANQKCLSKADRQAQNGKNQSDQDTKDSAWHRARYKHLTCERFKIYHTLTDFLI